MHSFLLKTRGELQWLSTEFEKNNWIRRLRLIKTKGENPSFSAAEYKVFPLVFFKSKKIKFNLPVTYERWVFFQFGVFIHGGFLFVLVKNEKEKKKTQRKKSYTPSGTHNKIHSQAAHITSVGKIQLCCRVYEVQMTRFSPSLHRAKITQYISLRIFRQRVWSVTAVLLKIAPNKNLVLKNNLGSGPFSK